MIDVEKQICNGLLKIEVKPNAKKTELLGVDKASGSLKVSVHAPPENNKANLEVVKFFSRLLKRKVVIKWGLTSKKKILLVY
ncbi:MAG: YggU family protein [Nanoarchaeota archaeon]|nr:YggU family protein [Nanoarchaeota archaeon]